MVGSIPVPDVDQHLPVSAHLLSQCRAFALILLGSRSSGSPDRGKDHMRGVVPERLGIDNGYLPEFGSLGFAIGVCGGST